MKRAISIFLLSALLLSSCSQSNLPEESQSAPQVSNIETIPEETELKDNVPEMDFGGDTMTFSTTENYHYEFDVEESIGEVANDSVYNRNLLMEDRFNVLIEKTVTDSRDQQTSFLRTSIMSNDQAFDVAAHFVYLAGGLILENLFMDWANVPYVEMEQPWWVNKINDSFSINDRLFAAVSDLCITNMQLAYVYLFNHKLAADYQVEDLYTVVDEGRWTLDYMYDLTSGIYQDADGNGKATNKDVYGLVSDTLTSVDCYFMAGGQPTVRETEDGLEVLIGSERAYAIYEKVYKLMYENPGAFARSDYEFKHGMFQNNQGLLMPLRLQRLYGEMREMDVDFGILPFPKYDESQTEYYNTCLDNYSVLMVPNNVGNLEMVGALTEAMSFESMKSVMPAFYEAALQGKYTRDRRSVDMLNLIMDSRVFDVTILYNSFFQEGRLAHILRETINGKREYVSYYEKYKSAYENQAESLYTALSELGQ